MKRTGWHGELITFLRENMHIPFRPGSMDCAMAAGAALKIITGTDPAAAFRNKYKTLAGGNRMLRKKGFADHVEYAASLYEELPSPLMAQTGDLVICENNAMGIVQGENIYIMMETGFGIVKLTRAIRAFRT